MQFQLIAARYGQLLLSELRARDAMGSSERAASSEEEAALRGTGFPSEAETAIFDVQSVGAEAVASGWLFIPPGTGEPKSWLVYAEIGADTRGLALFERRGRLRGDLGAMAFAVECCHCFFGRDIGLAALRGLARRLDQGRIRRGDVIRYLMSFEGAARRGRLLVFAEPSPWLTAPSSIQDADAIGFRLRLNA